MSLTELAECFEKIGRLQLRAGKLLRQLEIDPELLERPKAEPKMPNGVESVWEKLLDAWCMYRLDKTGKKPARHLGPSLTPERIKLVADAIRRHNLEKAKRAAIGLYLSPWHTGSNDTGKEYLEPERAFQIKSGRDMVEYFAGIYMELNSEL